MLLGHEGRAGSSSSVQALPFVPQAKGNTEEPHFPDLLYDLGPHSFPLKQLSF